MKQFNRYSRAKSDGKDSDRSRRFGRDRFSERESGRFGRREFGGGRSAGHLEMHQAICDKCGRECEVPFRPSGGKPVYCSDCFRKAGSSDSRGRTDQVGKELEMINEKLNKILRLLESD